jgi:LCP family protein required for cell wall assembly
MRYIDLSQQKGFKSGLKKTKRKLKRIYSFFGSWRAIFTIFFLAIFGFSVFFSGPLLLSLGKKLFSGPSLLFTFFKDSESLKENQERTNILLLGTGGEGHQGYNLSDTIILVSVSPKAKDVVLISIPRDLWVEDLKAKINTAYAFGEERKKGGGIELAESVVSKLFNLPVHYTVRIDFSGFEKAVDLVGGVDLNVERDFTDSKYPIEGKENDLCGYTIVEVEEEGVKKDVIQDATGSAVLVEDPFFCRYETIHFRKGLNHMDGKTALKFVRSRMGTNGEGSDFARSRRQQQVMLALKEKIFSIKTFFDPKKVISLLSTFGKSIDSNIKEEEIAPFLKLAQSLQDGNVRNFVLSSQVEGALLETPPTENYNGQWVLVPKGGNFQVLQARVKNFIFVEEKLKNLNP